VAQWTTDEELWTLARRELFTAVVGDVMDAMGLHRQFLPPGLSPLDDRMVAVGRAMPVLEIDVFGEGVLNAAGGDLAKPFGLLFRALDDLKPGEVYVCSGSSPRYALWGELMSLRATKCGAAGAVVDGFHRDTPGILALGFPTFSRGRYAQDQGVRGKVVDWRVPLEFPNGVRIEPGDIVFADLDGVLVVPRAAEDEAFTRALEKVRGEKLVREAIEAGSTTVEAFARYGIM
jgi:regulator of RNase E activity RraA